MKLKYLFSLMICLIALSFENLWSESLEFGTITSYLDADYVLMATIVDKAAINVKDPNTGKNSYYVRLKPIEFIKSVYPDSLIKREYGGKVNLWVKYTEKFDLINSPFRFIIGDSCLIYLKYSEYNDQEITCDETFATITNKQDGFRKAVDIIKNIKAATDSSYELKYSGGKTCASGAFKSGKPWGLWKFYDETGVKILSGTYNNYKKDGIWRYTKPGTPAYREYYYSGYIQRRSGVDSLNVKYDKKYVSEASPMGCLNSENATKTFDETRIINVYGAKGEFLQRNLIPDGAYSGKNASSPVHVRKFHANSNVSEEGMTLNGKKIGSWVYYDENLKPIKIEIYEDDGSLMEEKKLN